MYKEECDYQLFYSKKGKDYSEILFVIFFEHVAKYTYKIKLQDNGQNEITFLGEYPKHDKAIRIYGKEPLDDDRFIPDDKENILINTINNHLWLYDLYLSEDNNLSDEAIYNYNKEWVNENGKYYKERDKYLELYEKYPQERMPITALLESGSSAENIEDWINYL